ncbi:MAG: EamA family transporter [Lachnospiraceae bacterium]
MISLLLAVIMGVIVKIVYKYIEDKDIDGDSVMVINYVVTIAIASVLCIKNGIFSTIGIPENRISIIWCVVLGIFQAVMLVYNFLAIRKGIADCGASMTTVFSSIGNMFTVLISVLLFREMPYMIQWIGIVLAFGAIILTNVDFEHGLQWSFKTVLLWIAFMTCLMGINYKVIQTYTVTGYDNLFLLVSFFLSLLLSLVIFRKKHCKYRIREVIFGIIIGVPNIASSYFIISALKTVPATAVYPINSAGSIIVTVIVCAFLFHEKLKKNEILAILMTVIGVVFINLN